MADSAQDDGPEEEAQTERGDLIDRVPDWLVSRDEDDVISKRLDRAIRFLATIV